MERVAIVEDEKESQKNLMNLLRQYEIEHDVYFDIQCYDDGVHFLKDYQCDFSIVFITNMAQYAVEGYTVQAATWNRDLVEKYTSCYADEAHSFGVSGLYAPSENIHRSPFGGRNYEYYSEDPILSGYTAASFVNGATSKGLICYMKHFAMNEQETNRNSTCTFSNEQAIRELYLKGYETTTHASNVSAVMSSMNRIGAAWTGAHVGLLTEALRNEWGFTGYVITDACEGDYMCDTASGLRAGNDMWLSSDEIESKSDTDADIYYLRRASKNILYSEANADVVAAEMAPWHMYVYILDAVLAIIMVICIALLVRNVTKKKDEDEE